MEERLAARRILPVAEEELKHIVLDIHDGLVQNVFAALSQLASVRSQLTCYPDARTALDPALVRATGLLEAALAELRTFLGTFNPPDFAHRELRQVVEGLIAQHETLTGACVELTMALPLPPIPLPVKIAIYRILQEALANAHRHSGADTARVRIEVVDDARLRIRVSDEGHGFQPPTLQGPAATEQGRHIGLRGMRERAALVGGTFHVESEPGCGTRVVVEVPLDV